MTRKNIFIILLFFVLFICNFINISHGSYQTEFEVDGTVYNVPDYSDLLDGNCYCLVVSTTYPSSVRLYVGYSSDSFMVNKIKSEFLILDCKYYVFNTSITNWKYIQTYDRPSNGLRYSSTNLLYVLYSSVDIKDVNTGEVIFEETKENPDDIYNEQVNNMLSSNSDKYSNMANDIASGDFSSSLNEEDKTTVSGAANNIGKGFDGVFGIFRFIDSVKSAISNIFNMLLAIPHMDDHLSGGYPIYIPIESPYFSGNLDIKHWGDIYVKSWVKEFVDTAICSFAYLGFVWRIFKNLSNTIRGVETSTLDSVNVSKNSKD